MCRNIGIELCASSSRSVIGSHLRNFHWIRIQLCWLHCCCCYWCCRRHLSALHMQITARASSTLIDDSARRHWLDNWYLWTFRVVCCRRPFNFSWSKTLLQTSIFRSQLHRMHMHVHLLVFDGFNEWINSSCVSLVSLLRIIIFIHSSTLELNFYGRSIQEFFVLFEPTLILKMKLTSRINWDIFRWAALNTKPSHFSLKTESCQLCGWKLIDFCL